jgi:hypothetical protein
VCRYGAAVSSRRGAATMACWNGARAADHVISGRPACVVLRPSACASAQPCSARTSATAVCATGTRTSTSRTACSRRGCSPPSPRSGRAARARRAAAASGTPDTRPGSGRSLMHGSCLRVNAVGSCVSTTTARGALRERRVEVGLYHAHHRDRRTRPAAASAVRPPQKSSTSRSFTPTGTVRFDGRPIHALPVTVTIRSISGRPVSNTSAIAAIVPTFCTTVPTCSRQLARRHLTAGHLPGSASSPRPADT